MTAPDFLMLAGGQAITMRPAPTIPTVPAVTWCIDQVRAEGWCDCTGNSIPYEPDHCLDHNADAGGTCPDDGAALESDGVCTADDQPATTETVTIPFTTGSSTSTIESSSPAQSAAAPQATSA